MRRRLLPILAVVAVLAASCGSSAKHPGAAPTTTVPPVGSTGFDQNAALTVAVGAEPSQWNCDAAGAGTPTCLDIVDAVWPSVYHEAANGTPELDTDLVTSATVTSQSPQTVVYRINPKAAWHDGTPITYQDFVYDWQAQSGNAADKDAGGAPFTPATTDGYSDIASVTGSPSAPFTATVTFAHPDPDWQTLFGAGTPLVPAHLASRIGFDHGFTDPVNDLLSAGPYLVQTVVPGQSLTLVRNPRYWGAAANLSSVTFRFGVDPTALAGAFTAGELGAALDTADPTDPPSAAVLSALKGADGVNTSVIASATYAELLFNQADPALADPALRRAIMLVTPRATLLKDVVGATDASIGPLGDRFALPGSDAYKDGANGAYATADVSQARQVLTRAGYVVTPGQPLTKGGSPVALSLAVGTDVPGGAALATDLGSDLGQLGIAVTPSTSATPTTGSWAMAVTTATTSPSTSAQLATYETGSPTNVEHVADAKIDGLARQAATSLDPGRRQSALAGLDAALWAGYDDLPLFQLPTIVAASSDLSGAAPAAGNEGPTFDLSRWGIKPSS